MRQLFWMCQPEMGLFCGAGELALQKAFQERGWRITPLTYAPRKLWRQRQSADLLIWPFVPTQLDVWSARLFAKSQMSVVFYCGRHCRSLPGLTHWLTASRALQKRLLELGATPQQVTVVDARPGIESSATRNVRKELGLAEDTRLIYCGGPLVTWTGTRTAVWALNIVNYLHPQVHLLVHGTGGEQARIESFSQSIDQNKHTHRLDDSWPVQEVISQVDQVWLPLQEDGVPDALFFARRAGKVVLAARQPSLELWCKHEENALLLPADQPPQWAAASHHLLTEPLAAERLAQAASEGERGERGSIDPSIFRALFRGEMMQAA